MLFAPKGHSIAGLDSSIHYIMNGCYLASVSQDNIERWTCVVGIDDAEDKPLKDALLSKEPSEQNIKCTLSYPYNTCTM